VALKEQARDTCVFRSAARLAIGEETAERVNFIGQDIIGRALRAFEIDSACAARIDFRKGFVDHCQQAICVGHPTEDWQAVKDFRVNPVSPPGTLMPLAKPD
jgi:hypothetical protein